MKKTEYYCDHCGKVINQYDDYTEDKIDICGYPELECDLCCSCHEELVSVISNFITKKVEKNV